MAYLSNVHVVRIELGIRYNERSLRSFIKHRIPMRYAPVRAEWKHPYTSIGYIELPDKEYTLGVF